MDAKLKLAEDMRYLRQRYGWSDADATEVKAAAKKNRAWWRYWTILAAAHRAGYEQTEENGYPRLQLWCTQQGLSDPFAEDFDIAALQAMARENT